MWMCLCKIPAKIHSWVWDSQQFRIDGRPKLLPDVSTSCAKCRWSKLPRNKIWRSYNEHVTVQFSAHFNNWIYWVAGVESSLSLQSAFVIIKMLKWVDELLRTTTLLQKWILEINQVNEKWMLSIVKWQTLLCRNLIVAYLQTHSLLSSTKIQYRGYSDHPRHIGYLRILCLLSTASVAIY